MDSGQTWTVVVSIATAAGVFSAIMVATFTMFRSSIRADLNGLSTQIDARFDATDARIDSLARVTDVRLSSLEGDMSLVKAHLIGQRSA